MRLSPLSRSPLLQLSPLLAIACAAVSAGEAGPTLPKGEHPALTQSASGPEVAAVVNAFYAASFNPDELTTRLTAALATYPHNPDLHEVAAGLAGLRGDRDLAELHDLAAALDSGAAAATLHLRGLDPTHDLVVQTVRLLAAQARDPELRAEARQVLLRADRLRGDDTDATLQLSALGTLTRWRLLGAFDNDEGKGFLAKYPPEQAIDVTATSPGMLVPVRWRRIPGVGRLGDIPFEPMMWPNRQAVAYAATFLSVASAQDAVLWVSSAAPLRVFFDGQLALSREALSASDPDNVAVHLHLTPGPHTLLIKSANKGGVWSVAARLTTDDGSVVPGLVQSDEPSSKPTPAPTPQAFPQAFKELATLRGLSGALIENRQYLLGGMTALWSGDPKLAVQQLSAFAANAPNNPMALLALALASNENDEQGKALDLLNDGVSRFGAALPQFLFSRARVYVDKGLYEKAQVDAEAFLRARPHDLAGQLLLARIEGRRSFQVERCRTLTDAVADHPRQGIALRELASCKLDEGRHDDARSLLARARTLAPGNRDTLEAILELERRGFEDAAATRTAEALRRLDPTSTGLLMQSGEVAERGGRLAAARSFYQVASDLSPDNPQPLIRLAELAYRGGDETEATRLWSEAALRDPGNGLLSERLEHLKPTHLGFIERFIPSDEVIAAAVADGKTVAPQEGSHVIFLLDDEITDVHADGSSTRVVTEVNLAVNDQGRDELIQAHLPTAGRVKLLKAYALSKSGERQEAASVRGGLLRFRNFAVGSTVVLQYVHYAPPAHFLPNEYVADWSFQSVAREHRLSRWTLVLPKDRPLHVQITGDVQRRESEAQGNQVHVFEARNVPPLIEEPLSPPIADLHRHVSVSTVAGWEDYVRWERALLSDAFQESTDLGALAQKLTAGAKTPAEKLDRLSAYVAEEVRYQMDYETSIAGVRPHSCRQILERSYGDCKDKAVLLISLGRAVGIKLDFAILRTLPAGQVEREVPNQQFNHAITYVPKQAGFAVPFFVDTTTDGLDVGNLRADDQGALSLVLDPDEKEGFEFIQIPYRTPDQEFSRSEVSLRVGADGKIAGKDRMVLRGEGASAIRRILKNQGYARKLDEQLASYIFPGSTLSGAEAGDPNDLWHPITLTLDVDDSNALQTNEGARRLRLPVLPGLDRLTSLVDRKAPLRIGVPETTDLHVTVALPSQSRVAELPHDFKETPRCLSIERQSRTKGDQIDVRLKMVRTCAEITPAEYPAFRTEVLRALSRMQEQLAFAPAASTSAKIKPKK